MKTPFLLQLRNNSFRLYPEKAVFWEQKSALLISDAHFGKVSHFRKSGMQVPAESASDDPALLKHFLENLKPEKCIFLGDLFHSHHNNEWNRLEALMGSFSNCRFYLIRGNHDILDEKYFEKSSLEVSDEMRLDDFYCTHYPVESPGLLNICGHLHPGVKMYGKAYLSETLPCYFLRPNQLILPSFGKFTGMKTVRPKNGDRIFVVTHDTVLEIPAG